MLGVYCPLLGVASLGGMHVCDPRVARAHIPHKQAGHPIVCGAHAAVPRVCGLHDCSPEQPVECVLSMMLNSLPCTLSLHQQTGMVPAFG